MLDLQYMNDGKAMLEMFSTSILSMVTFCVLTKKFLIDIRLLIVTTPLYLQKYKTIGIVKL